MTTIALLITLMTMMTALIGSAVYWWAECQRAKNELFVRDMDEASTPIQYIYEEQMRINLNKMANELTELEGGNVNLTVAQVKDVLAALGDRWRTVSPEQAASEYAAIVERAGLREK